MEKDLPKITDPQNPGSHGSTMLPSIKDPVDQAERPEDQLVDVETGDIVNRCFPRPKEQLPQFVDRLIVASYERNIRNTRITSKLNQERPYDPSRLKEAGMGWRANVSTRPLSRLINSAYRRFPRAINEAKYLTNAQLPTGTVDGRAKTAFFRNAITQFIRSTPDWKDTVEGLAFENTVFGYTAAIWFDEESWMPTAVRQDELFVGAGTKQHVSSASFIIARKDMLVHEAARHMLDLIAKHQQPGFAESAPYEWDLAEYARTINEAVPDDIRSRSTEHIRIVEDLRRQLSLASAFGTGVKVVPVHHVFVVEPSSKVSHYIVDARRKKLLFVWQDRYESLAAVATFFAFEIGDRTLLGSKGVGRVAYNMASISDRATNEVIDKFQMAGKVLLKAPEARHRRLKATAMGAFLLIDENFEVVPNLKMEVDVQDAVGLDRFLQTKLDLMAGTVSAPDIEGERVTATAVNLLASREGEQVDDSMSRWLQQFGYMISEITRRLVVVDTTDPKVLELRRTLQSRLSADELQALVASPALTTTAGWTGAARQAIVMACSEARGVPVYDQFKIESAKLEALVGPEFAEEVLMQQNDPTQMTEQSRQQMMETGMLMEGMPIPVSPRDSHQIHLGVLAPAVQHAAMEFSQNPGAAQALEMLVGHGRAHLETAKQQGAQGLEQFEQLFSQAENAIQQIKSIEANAAQQTAPVGAPQEMSGNSPAPGVQSPPQ
jgi:hypothetical protein